MANLTSFFLSRAVLALFGALCFGVFIWFLGPLISIADYTPLRSPYVRLACILFLLLVWIVVTLWRKHRVKKQNEAVLNAMVEDNIDSAANEAQKAEAALLNDKMQEAVTLLKSRDFSKTGGKKFIYELPWYLIIGPPGAGKTTLLSNSGLNFPLEETHGKNSIKGVGGTRNCDWWFTDQAVLLDTAGRYTTQDSDAATDSSAWDTFLQLLKDNRTRRPVNGLFVALALHDIVTGNTDQLIQVAKTIRFRIEETHQKFGMCPPVYLIITKCDLLSGFTEYFSDLNEKQRQQVWGFTVESDDTKPFSEHAEIELALLRETLNAQLTQKLQSESSQQRRDQIYGFPMQFAAIDEKLKLFIDQFSASSRLQEKMQLRGLYFTSATQDGSPFDQVVSLVANSFGFTTQNTQQASGSGKSFFINQLLTDVVFAEAGLAGTNLKGEKRLSRIQIVAAAAIGLLTVGVLGLWGASFSKNQRALTDVVTNSEVLEQQLKLLPSDSLDLVQTSAMLTSARDINRSEAANGFVATSTGLDQSEKIAVRAKRKYDELLIDGLLARLMVRLEQQMHAESDNSEFLFEALKTYQMIDNKEEFESDDIIGWFQFDFDQNLPQDLSPEHRADLTGHLQQLFKEQPKRLPRALDKDLIDQYQQVAARTPLDQRAYFRLKQLNSQLINTPLQLTSTAGVDLARALSLTGERTFNNAIPEFFTLDAYRNSFLPASAKITETLSDDKWVLGSYTELASSADPQTMTTSVINQYYSEYRDTWQGLLDELTLRQSSDIKELSDFIALITDANSPLKNLLVTVASQTTLTSNKISEQNNATTTGSAESNERKNELNALIGSNKTPSADTTADEVDPVTSHFDSLHKLVEGAEKNESRLDALLKEMASLNLQLLPMSETPGALADSKLSGELAVKLRQLSVKADRLPGPVARMVSELANDVNDASSGGFCAQLNTLWETQVYPFYQKALQNRYPLNRRASNEITLQDFGRFFSSGGILDTFVTQNLANNVQKTPGQWTWVGSGSTVCLNDNTLKQLALADDIRNSFFSSGTQTPSFSFSLDTNNLAVAKSIDQLFLSVGNRKAEFFHGPVKGSTSYLWPGEGGNTEASLRVEPVIPGSASRISHNGPWAVLRLLDQGRLRQANSSSTLVDYNFSGRQVSLQFQTSAFNPLNSRALRQFSCPKTL